ncbi:MAG: hypothetical protein ABSH47_27530 [Bryobacteraceae bacterium]|jgi:hypothetical protein
MRIETRIRKLEAKMITDPIILHFADGTTRELCWRGTYLLSLMRDVCRGEDLSPWQAEQLELVRRSVWAEEPGGARLTEVVRCLLHAQAVE